MCTFSANVFRSRTGCKKNGFANMIYTKSYWYCYIFEMHANKCSPNVQSSMRLDMFYSNRITHTFITVDCPAATSMRLWNHIHFLIAKLFSCFTFNNQSTIQMFTALRCKIYPVVIYRFIYSRIRLVLKRLIM